MKIVPSGICYFERVCLLAVVAAMIACGGDDPSSDGATDGAADGSTSNGPGAGGGAGTSGSGGLTGADPTTSTGSGAGTSGPVDPSCHLDNAAFCDAFTKASPGGRGGDLDDGNWAFARLGMAGTAGANYGFIETPIDVCGEEKTVEPGGADSQFCKTPDNDPRWVEALHDNHGFVYIAPRVRQPFDFAGRTGTIQWEADAKTDAGHSWWLETWITDAPVSGANQHDPQVVTSKEAIGITFFDTCGTPPGPGTTGSGKVGVSEITITHDYHADYIDFEHDDCVSTAPGELNKFQIRLSESHVEIWAADIGSDALRRIASADIALGFSRGYLHTTHVHYNAAKTNEGNDGTVTSYQTYHWARVAFDGPHLPNPRAYGIPDPLTPADNTNGDAPAFNIGYAVSNDIVSDGSQGLDVPATLKFEGVDPSGGASANLNFNTVGVAAGDTLKYRLNGKAWHEYQTPANLEVSWERQAFTVPVPVSDLIAGDNTVEFGTNSAPFFLPANSMYIANIDLEIQLQ